MLLIGFIIVAAIFMFMGLVILTWIVGDTADLREDLIAVAIWLIAFTWAIATVGLFIA